MAYAHPFNIITVKWQKKKNKKGKFEIQFKDNFLQILYVTLFTMNNGKKIEKNSK